MRERHKTYYIIASLYILVSTTFGKEAYLPHFKKISVDNGLSESSVYCIMQDSRGYMWFGTKDGLNKYDGNRFEVFRGINNHQKDSQTLKNNFIRSLAEINDSLIFIGTDAGLYMMNSKSEQLVFMDSTYLSGHQITSAITSFCKDKKGNIWIGTMLQGLYQYNIQKKKTTKVAIHNHSLERKAIWAIF